MIDFGYFALCLALLTSGTLCSPHWRAGAATGWRWFALQKMPCWPPACNTLAVCVLWHALLTHSFQVRFVAENPTWPSPILHHNLSWGGQAGSLLFWGWILSLYIAAVVLLYRHRYRELMRRRVSHGSKQLFFCILHLFSADPCDAAFFNPKTDADSTRYSSSP